MTDLTANSLMTELRRDLPNRDMARWIQWAINVEPGVDPAATLAELSGISTEEAEDVLFSASGAQSAVGSMRPVLSGSEIVWLQAFRAARSMYFERVNQSK